MFNTRDILNSRLNLFEFTLGRHVKSTRERRRDEKTFGKKRRETDKKTRRGDATHRAPTTTLFFFFFFMRCCWLCVGLSGERGRKGGKHFLFSKFDHGYNYKRQNLTTSQVRQNESQALMYNLILHTVLIHRSQNPHTGASWKDKRSKRRTMEKWSFYNFLKI